jgi:hypothetical protein
MESERNLVLLKPPRWGRVIPADGVVPFVAVDDLGQPIDPIHRYLRDFLACGNRSSSVHSYAYVLMRWWRFLIAVRVDWDRATPAEGRDFVLWMMQARKSVAGRRTLSARTVGRTNPVRTRRITIQSFG